MFKRFAMATIAALGCMSAFTAGAVDQKGFYAGGSFGQSTIKVDSAAFDASGTGFKVFGGFTFNQYFSGEAEYFNWGHPEQTTGTTKVTDGLSGYGLTLIGRAWVGDAFAFFGKFGYAHYSETTEVTVPNVAPVTGDDSGIKLTYGIGMTVPILKKYAVRAEYEFVDVRHTDAYLISVGGVYKF